MRIALTTDCFWPRVNGVSVAVQTQLEQLRALGHKLFVAAPEYPLPPSQPDPPEVHRVPSRKSWVSSEDRLATRKGILIASALIEEFQPDIVHAHTEFALTLAAARTAKRLGVPLLMTSHTYFEQYLHHYIPYLPKFVSHFMVRMLTRKIFHSADIIITPGLSMVDTLRRYGLKQPIRNIPTGIDPGPFTTSPRTPPSTKPKLLYVGRIAQEKNVFFLLDVLETVLCSLPESQLRIVGDGPSRKEFEREVARRGLESNVEVLGYRPYQEIAEHYRSSDVFVFPSRTETQGLVTLEALMTGTPVVAVGERGSAEVLRDGEGAHLTGYNVKEFSSKVLDLLLNPGHWMEMNSKAHAYAQSWTAPVLTRKLEAVYSELSPGSK